VPIVAFVARPDRSGEYSAQGAARRVPAGQGASGFSSVWICLNRKNAARVEGGGDESGPAAPACGHCVDAEGMDPAACVWLGILPNYHE